MDGADSGAISAMNERQGELKYPQETCPSATWSITDLT
jgi:hypothetical protein